RIFVSQLRKNGYNVEFREFSGGHHVSHQVADLGDELANSGISSSLKSEQSAESGAHVIPSNQETPSAFIARASQRFRRDARQQSRFQASESTSPKTQSKGLLVVIQDRLRCRFAQFKLCAHFL